MSIAAKEWDAGGHWAPFVPGDKAPWNLHRVVHLHRRAGFAATWKELRRDLADGPGPSVTRVLDGRARARACGKGRSAAAWRPGL